MNTYFSTNLKDKPMFVKIEVIRQLTKLSDNTLATIQWDMDTDDLYCISSLDPSVENASDQGHIWTFLPANYLLEKVIKDLGE